MINTIELHGYLFLHDIFRQRGWTNPRHLTVETETPALELLAELDIPEEKVGVIFVNGKAQLPSRAAIHPGDRIALVSPGAPMFMDLGSHEQAYGFIN
jgi:sulfur carrier protein ThiS